MATITTNTSATSPSLWITTVFNGTTPDFTSDTEILSVTCLQDITVTNSTGTYSYTTFCDVDTRKITTPSDNSISTNIVLEDTVFFGSTTAGVTGAQQSGLFSISNTKQKVGFRVYFNDKTASGSTSKYLQGVGYITNVAPTVSPDQPIWVSPLEIAVDGGYTLAVGVIN